MSTKIVLNQKKHNNQLNADKSAIAQKSAKEEKIYMQKKINISDMPAYHLDKFLNNFIFLLEYY